MNTTRQERPDDVRLTMGEYAKSRHISYNAVRRQVSETYKKELEGHAIRENGKIFLDAYAVYFLDEHRQERTVIVQASEEDTQKQIDALREALEKAQSELLSKQEQIIELLRENANMIEYKAKSELLLETSEKAAHELEEVKEALNQKTVEAESLKVRVEYAEREAQSFKPSLFGFYRKA